MRRRAGILIVDQKDNTIALMYRKKHGCEYYVVPGGGVEDGESIIDAALREIKEELNVTLTSDVLTDFASFQTNDTKEYYFIAYMDTCVHLEIVGEETSRNTEDNVYIPKWIPINDITSHDVRPKEIHGKMQSILHL